MDQDWDHLVSNYQEFLQGEELPPTVDEEFLREFRDFLSWFAEFTGENLVYCPYCGDLVDYEGYCINPSCQEYI